MPTCLRPFTTKIGLANHQRSCKKAFARLLEQRKKKQMLQPVTEPPPNAAQFEAGAQNLEPSCDNVLEPQDTHMLENDMLNQPEHIVVKHATGLVLTTVYFKWADSDTLRTKDTTPSTVP